MAPHPPDLVGLLLAALIATVVVTPVLSLLVLWWYRRAVGRSMRATARRLPVAPVPVAVPEHAPRARPARTGDRARRGAPARRTWGSSR